jgi:hypothetical protein
MPIGADLVLHEEADPEEILLDARRLGRVVEKTARRYRTPLAFPLMDLRLEKADLLEFVGVPESELDLFHFQEPPTEELLEGLRRSADRPFSERLRANPRSCALHRGADGSVAGPDADRTLFPHDKISRRPNLTCRHGRNSG